MLRQVLPFTTRYYCQTPRLTFRCLDIGTGASAIYPLLLAAESNRMETPYRIVATDIDADSVELARRNVRDNHLESQISVLHVANSGDIDKHYGPLRMSLASIPETDRALDFCLTNPPFFDDSKILQEPRQGDGRDRTNMSVSEGSYPGGELVFCLDIFADGLWLWMQHHARDPQRQPACMCGKKSSWLQLKAIVTHVLGPGHVMATEFGPGHLTRWFLAWTMYQPKIDSPLARHGSDLSFSVGDCACDDVVQRFEHFFGEFPDARFEIVRRVPAACGLCLFACATSLKCSMPADMDTADQLPSHLQEVLSLLEPSLYNTLMPPEGNMLLNINLSIKQPEVVFVQVDCYTHTTRGRPILDKIRNQLVGEICRTSRRWRRRLKQHQQRQIVDMEME